MADTLVADYDAVEVLHRLVEYCVELLDAAAAGLLLADQRGSLQVLASSTEGIRLLELFHLQTNEGPCMDAYRTGERILVDDLAAASARWPTFAPQAVKDGFASVHALPLRLRGEVIGALNLFGHHTGPLTPADLRVAQALADTATIGIFQERTIRRGEVLTEQLQTALNSRVIIEQAKGVLSHAADPRHGRGFHRAARPRPGSLHPPLRRGHRADQRQPRPPSRPDPPHPPPALRATTLTRPGTGGHRS